MTDKNPNEWSLDNYKQTAVDWVDIIPERAEKKISKYDLIKRQEDPERMERTRIIV